MGSPATFWVYAEDSEGRFRRGKVVATVEDINDSSPVWDQVFYSMEVSTHATVGTSVGRIVANDADYSECSNIP